MAWLAASAAGAAATTVPAAATLPCRLAAAGPWLPAASAPPTRAGFRLRLLVKRKTLGLRLLALLPPLDGRPRRLATHYCILRHLLLRLWQCCCRITAASCCSMLLAISPPLESSRAIMTGRHLDFTPLSLLPPLAADRLGQGGGRLLAFL